jgi:hypothetical protein
MAQANSSLVGMSGQILIGLLTNASDVVGWTQGEHLTISGASPSEALLATIVMSPATLIEQSQLREVLSDDR